MISKINWSRVVHIRMTKDGSSLDIPADVKQEYPSVNIITNSRKPNLFNTIVYSINHLNYDLNKIHWYVNLDWQDIELAKTVSSNLKDIKDINIYPSVGKYKLLDFIKDTIDGETESLNFILLDGDIVNPDALRTRFRSLVFTHKKCVFTDILGWYDIQQKKSFIGKYYTHFPYSGLYFKTSWWKLKRSDETASCPYLPTIISLTKPSVKCRIEESSINFYNSLFDKEIHSIITKERDITINII